jgi:hypothetical protein
MSAEKAARGRIAMEQNSQVTRKANNNLATSACVIAVALAAYLFVSLQSTNGDIEIIRMKSLLSYGMTESQANYSWGSTPVKVRRNDKDMLPDIPANLVPEGGKLVRYSSITPSSYCLVHFDEGGKIDFLYFWLS